MQYVWSNHAASERLPERSGLSQQEIENRLRAHKYVVSRNHYGRIQEHHLIWDEVKKHLIDVPVISTLESGFIPTVLPVNYGSGYPEWQLAEAEQVWRGNEYYTELQKIAGSPLDVTEVLLANVWYTPSGWLRHEELFPLLSWFVYEPDVARSGDVGVLALFRKQAFRETVSTLLRDWTEEITAPISNNERRIVIKKCGAHRLIPLKFFLSTP